MELKRKDVHLISSSSSCSENTEISKHFASSITTNDKFSHRKFSNTDLQKQCTIQHSLGITLIFKHQY